MELGKCVNVYIAQKRNVAVTILVWKWLMNLLYSRCCCYQPCCSLNMFTNDLFGRVWKKDVSWCIGQPCSNDLQFTLFYVCIVTTGELLVSCPSRYPWFYIEHKKLLPYSFKHWDPRWIPLSYPDLHHVTSCHGSQFMTILVRAVIEHTCFQPTVFLICLAKRDISISTYLSLIFLLWDRF